MVKHKKINTQSEELILSQAAYYTKLSADTGFEVAQYNLGQFYAQGIGVPQSDTEAFRYYLMAAEQYFLDAVVAVAECYQQGKGVEQDLQKAEEYFKLAEEIEKREEED